MNHWEKLSNRLNEWGSPLRPCSEDVKLYENQVGPKDRTLLLGVTQELLHLADVAVDNNQKVVETIGAKAVLADWGDLPFKSEFDVAIGDGSLSAFQGGQERFFQQMRKVLNPGGKLVLRLNLSPEKKEEVDYVLSLKEKMGFHAFKMRVAHALANPFVPVQEIYNVIQPVWNHPTLEIYRNSDWIYYFPKLSELPKPSHIQFATSYEIAERFPVATWQF